jgi:alpha-galactosidase
MIKFHAVLRSKISALALGATLVAPAAAQTTGPVKVFLLAGQSNMQGHGFITEQAAGIEVQGTLRHFVDNNPGYAFLRPAGNWVVRNDTWMWVRQGPVGSPNSDTYSTGNLTAGFGAGTNIGPTSWAIGPEFGMGMKLGDYFNEEVVIVKICWGGTSLVGDWRPPSTVAKRGGVVGSYYNIFLSTWQQAQAAITARYPGRAIEVKGFGWHQGENDRFSAAATAEYEANLADLIVDLRAALNAPGMPVVIATTSDGPVPTAPNLWLDIENAQLAMSARENVSTVSTRPNYRLPAVSPRNEDIHWNKNAESVYKNGELMGDAMVALLSTPDSPDATPPSPNPPGFATPPTALNSASVTMTANTATDINGVQYRFVETTGNPGATSSDWQYSPSYVDTGLAPGTTYSYAVQARDQSVAGNTTAAQAAVSATTFPVDTAPPAPNPMTFATAPAAANAITINMTATTAVDANYPVEYFFEETTNTPGGTDSGWQSSPAFSDSGLRPGTTYSYRVKARDKEAAPNETGWSAVLSATTPAVPAGTIVWSTPSDISGPSDVSTSGALVTSYTGHNAGGNVTVNGVVFAQGRIPNAQSSGGDIGSRVPSTGNTGYDTFLRSISWNYTGGKVTFTGLTPGASYEVQIWAADNVNTPTGMTSIVLNHGTIYAVSLLHEPLSGAPGQFTTGTFTASGTTQEFNLATYNYYGTPSQAVGGAAITNGLQLRLVSGVTADTTPPTPNPSSWATPPAAGGSTSITMTASTASDASGVEYFFDETTNGPGGSDSGWQDSPSYTDSGLAPSTLYTYTVRVRDKSPAQNATTASSPASATTSAASPTSTRVWNINLGNSTVTGTNQIATTDNFIGAAAENTANSIWNGIAPASGVVASTTLNDSTGSATNSPTFQGSTSGGQLGSNNNTLNPGDKIFRTWVKDDDNVHAFDFTFGNLNSASTYSLVVYSDWTFDSGTGGMNIVQTAGSGLTGTFVLNRYIGPGPAANGSVGPLLRDTDPANTAATVSAQTNFARFDGLTPSGSNTLTFRFGPANGPVNGFQLVETSSVTPDDYTTWAAIYAPANLSDPAADLDGDGMTNDEERAFGLNPTSGSSVNPISVPFNRAAGTFSYTRRNRVLTKLDYTVWTSTTLGTWTEDTTAVQVPGTVDVNGMQIVGVTLTPGLPAAPALFVRVRALESAAP